MNSFASHSRSEARKTRLTDILLGLGCRMCEYRVFDTAIGIG